MTHEPQSRGISDAELTGLLREVGRRALRIVHEGQQLTLMGDAEDLYRVYNRKAQTSFLITGETLERFGLRPDPPTYQKQPQAEQTSIFDNSQSLF